MGGSTLSGEEGSEGWNTVKSVVQGRIDFLAKQRDLRARVMLVLGARLEALLINSFIRWALACRWYYISRVFTHLFIH
jgi:hypothetical protein